MTYADALNYCQKHGICPQLDARDGTVSLYVSAYGKTDRPGLSFDEALIDAVGRLQADMAKKAGHEV